MRSQRTFLCYFILASTLSAVIGHYIGESLQTTVLSAHGKVEATKAQWPLFGVDSTVKIPRSQEKFSLGFEENYHQLSWFDTNNLGKLRVTFLYSRSGDGMIASVTSQPVMKTINEEYSTHHFDVEYRWVEEQPIGIASACIIMFLATLMVSLLLVFSLCGFSDDEQATPESSEEIDTRDFSRRRGELILRDD
jgi:hypothetical protein